jgi:nucleotide-binding universal stress UspA family protein
MFKNVLLAIDLNHEESWRKALPVALAACRVASARLHAVTGIPDLHMPMIASYFPDDFMAKVAKDTREKLAQFCSRHVPGDVECVQAVVSTGAVYEMLMRYADDNEVDLIVMGAYHPDLKDYLLGSNAEKVVRHARQSVLVVKD